MDKVQRSFSFKPTRFLVYSFTISSSLLFFLIFSFLVYHNTPSFPQESSFHFNTTTSLSFPLTHIKVEGITSLTSNFTITEVKTPILNDTHFRKLDKSSRGGVDSVGKKLLANLSQAEVGSLESLESSNFRESKKILVSKKVEEIPPNKEKIEEIPFPAKKEKKSSDCDVSHGRWIYDESYPLYTSLCPFIDEGFSCQANGRSDKDYMKWRWQPYDCNLPRFNASKMLEMIRGKRLVFVGDSMNRNQWESMLCLLIGAIKDPKRVYEIRGRKITKEKGNYSFKFLDYKCTVEYYVSHYLVHESKARVKQKRVQTLKIDAMDRGSSRWKGADIVVFNTAHWWSHYKTKSGVNYYQEGQQVHPYLDALTAFRKALTTWASWVDKNINPQRTKVFFRTSAPSHFKGGQWNSGGHCKDGIQPLNDTSTAQEPEKNLVVEEVIKGMKTPVNLLNITRLSGFRIDGHPSIYGKRQGKGSSSASQDCSHWCLPGVPDTWNELLYFFLLSERKQILNVE